jgi:MFS family permease
MLARSLTSPDAKLPVESLKALDWLNFFLAALLMGFGPFVAVHLAENGWVPASIGAILTISGLAGLTTQVPAGELIDMIESKRALFGAAASAAALALTILGLRSDFPAFLVQASPLLVWAWLGMTRSPSDWDVISVLQPLEAC